jgi:hypothetical protein
LATENSCGSSANESTSTTAASATLTTRADKEIVVIDPKRYCCSEKIPSPPSETSIRPPAIPP